jgi:hypothetical protein
MTDTAHVILTHTAYLFGLRNFPHGSNPVTGEHVRDAVYEAVVIFERPPFVYKVPDRDGNGMTIIAYRAFDDHSKIIGVHVVWRHRDSFPKSGCGPECCGP